MASADLGGLDTFYNISTYLFKDMDNGTEPSLCWLGKCRMGTLAQKPAVVSTNGKAKTDNALSASATNSSCNSWRRTLLLRTLTASPSNTPTYRYDDCGYDCGQGNDYPPAIVTAITNLHIFTQYINHILFWLPTHRIGDPDIQHLRLAGLAHGSPAVIQSSCQLSICLFKSSLKESSAVGHFGIVID